MYVWNFLELCFLMGVNWLFLCVVVIVVVVNGAIAWSCVSVVEL